ncbi:MAG: hypothetical protein AB7J13_07565 [Pyrinomonadaceae bacterium]
MKETSLEKRGPSAVKEKAQYGLAFGVIAVMLWVVGFPVFMLAFFAALSFFVWRVFTAESRNETRKIFEFYLSANEILRDDDRRWFGFEIQETIARGESVLRSMSTPPPLVHFAVGALYQKIGHHGSAAKHLADAIEAPAGDETAVVFPPRELREYVRLLRRIERAPAESPMTSAAVRALERTRRNRGPQMLELSRSEMSTGNNELAEGRQQHDGNADTEPRHRPSITDENAEVQAEEKANTYRFADFARSKRRSKAAPEAEVPDRQTISEVLHDIYDKNA